MAKIKFLKRPVVEERVALKRSMIYKLIKEGKFPQPVRLSTRSVAWVEDEVDRWNAERVQERDAEVE